MTKRTNSGSVDMRIWGIRAGKAGEAHELFVGSGIIALADAELGDLTKITNTRNEFYKAYRDKHPEDSRTGSAGIGGKFFRFIHEVMVDDLVVYPAILEKVVYIGSISGGYIYEKESSFPHQRSVLWKFIIPKNEFSLAARYELGAARTFFEFKRNVRELLTRIGEKSPLPLQSSSKVF